MHLFSSVLLAAALCVPAGLLPLSDAQAAEGGFSGPTSSQSGGFQGPSATAGANTVAKALKSSDDTYVSLTGHITSRIGKEKYTFQDETGSITIEIDDKKFYGRTVTPETTVRIVGEVDWHVGSNEIDVDYLEIVK